MEKVRLAVLGLNQGARMVRRLKTEEEVDLVAVAGFGSQAEEVAKEADVPLYVDYQALLKEVPLDGVIVALPNNLHLPAVKAALEAGIKYLLVEKPVAGTLEDSQEVVDRCREAGATLLIGHQRRSSTKYQFMKDFLASGKLGNIVSIQAQYALAKQLDYWEDGGSGGAWHKLASGGPLYVNAIHEIDGLNFLTGVPVKQVYAAKRHSIRGNEAEDSASVLLEYEDGVTVTFFISDGTPAPFCYDILVNEDERFCQYPGNNCMTIYGTDGTFCFPNMDWYHYPSKDLNNFGWFHPLVHEHFDVPDCNPLQEHLRHFVNLIKGRETVPRCSGEDAMASVRTIDAIVESANTGTIVAL